jgi:hypothetical protein
MGLKVTYQSSLTFHFTNERLDQLSDKSQSASDGQKTGTAGGTQDGRENHSSKPTSSRLESSSGPGWGGGQKEIISTHRCDYTDLIQ